VPWERQESDDVASHVAPEISMVIVKTCLGRNTVSTRYRMLYRDRDLDHGVGGACSRGGRQYSPRTRA
jgi:hypothetical protein